MNVFKCVCVGIVAILLCGCFEGGGEFDAINLGKVNAIYENGALKIVELNKSNSNESTNDSRGSIFDESQRVASETKQKSGLRRHEQGNKTNGLLTKRVASLPDLSQKDSAPFVLFFFTSTCGVCKAQIPILEQLTAQGIRIYAILGDLSDAKKVNDFTNANKISLPLFYESGAKRFFTSAVGGVKGVPVMAIFKEGKMTEKFIGLTPKGTLLKAI